MSDCKVIINGVGSCIPERRVRNEDFLNAEFYQENGEKFTADNAEIIRKFEGITGIKSRRYANVDQVASDLATIAAKNALANSTIVVRSLTILLWPTILATWKWVLSAPI